MARGVEVFPAAIRCRGLAVQDEASASGQTSQEVPRLFCERMLGAVACSVDPSHGRGRRHVREGVKHGENRCRSHARAEQDDRALARTECKAASRTAHVQQVPDLDLAVQVGASGTDRLEIHAPQVASLSLRTGQ